MGERDRRTFLSSASTWFMAGGIAASYGACGAMGGRYLFPARGRETHWQLVARTDQLAPGESRTYQAPTGERIAVARRGEGQSVEDFVALSSTCPHLGCQVHWEAARTRFFCPCHNGAFDQDGAPLEGPPAEAGQSLPSYPLRVEGGLLFIEVPVDAVARAEGSEAPLRLASQDAPPGPGHDPCLFPADDPGPGRDPGPAPGDTEGKPA